MNAAAPLADSLAVPAGSIYIGMVIGLPQVVVPTGVAVPALRQFHIAEQ